MFIYWTILLIPIIALLYPFRSEQTLRIIQLFLFGLFLVIVIGFRHEVGGDWFSYIENYSNLNYITYAELFTKGNIISGDYGYEFLHWFFAQYYPNEVVYFVNLVCAVIFISGLFRFCNTMPLPWLAILISIPYLVTVVSMGYTRQSVVIGLSMWGLVDLMSGKRYKFYLAIMIGFLFHKTAILMLVFGLLYNRSFKRSTIVVLIVLVPSVFLVYSLLGDSIKFLVYHYITDTRLYSSGALIRISLSVVSVLLFFYFRKKWEIYYRDISIWYMYSFATLLLSTMVFYIPTAVDRIALYLFPLQIVTLSRLPTFFDSVFNRTIVVIGIIFLHLSVLFVWLMFGVNSAYWVPYSNFLLI